MQQIRKSIRVAFVIKVLDPKRVHSPRWRRLKFFPLTVEFSSAVPYANFSSPCSTSLRLVVSHTFSFFTRPSQVANELRAYHAGLLLQSSECEQVGLSRLEQRRSLDLPALSLLPVMPQLSPFAPYLPGQTIARDDEPPLEGASAGGPQAAHGSRARTLRHRLSRQAVSSLYELTKIQPLLGHALNSFLHPGSPHHQHLCIGLCADALLTNLPERRIWRHLQNLSVPSAGGFF